MFHAPNNPTHHPDPPVDSFSDPQCHPARAGLLSSWPVDYPRSLPKPDAAVLDVQDHTGGEWPENGEW